MMKGTKRKDGCGLLFGQRLGVAGELLVIIALLASTTVLVMTFTGQQDVPNVNKESVSILQDIRDVISRAILEWLKGDPLPQSLACNGVYVLDDIDTLLLESLRPFIEASVADVDFEEGKLTALPGAVEGVEFAGLEGLTITLADGSIIYNDSSIYSEDNFDKEYFFNVRLPLALKVVQDWLACDAGNLSRHLAVNYGPTCFYGKKDPNYPGSCPKRKYRVSQEDRDYILAHSITQEHIAKSARSAIEELDKYFAGERSCKAAPLASNSGITCSFDIKEFQAVNYMSPYSSSMLPKKPGSEAYETRGIFDTELFWQNDNHVYLLPSRTIERPYNDQELSCNTEIDRTDVTYSINTNVLPYEKDLIDVATGSLPEGFEANPILYLNITRGAKFVLGVKCKDEQASLLGQPLEYKFSIKYGVMQHCGPLDQKNGNFMCNGCGLKPGVNGENCIFFSKAKGCPAYYQRCHDGLMWEIYINKTPDLKEYADECDWKGSTAATIADCWAKAAASGDYSYFDMLNATCDTVLGHESKYPPPKQIDPKTGREELVCPMSFGYVCCAVPGYNDTCSPPSSFANTACFTDIPTYLDYCSAPVFCKPPGFSCGETCYDWKCDKASNTCVEDQTKVLYNVPCGGDQGCFTCGSTGVCGFDPTRVDKECQTPFPSGGGADCRKYTCQSDSSTCGGGCVSAPDPSEDGRICSPRYEGDCSEYKCSNGECKSQFMPIGTPCGTYEYPNSACPSQGDLCSVRMTCEGSESGGVRCTAVESTRDCRGCPSGGGGCPCGANSDGSCKPC